MPYTPAAKAIMLSALGQMYFSVHTDDPGITGANEVSGGTPAYARAQATTLPIVNGLMSFSTPIYLDIPAGVTVKYVGIWDAATGGTFLVSYLASPMVFSEQGTYEVAVAQLSLPD